MEQKTKVQIYGHPTIYEALRKELVQSFDNLQLTVTDQEFIPDQQLYLVSISSYLKGTYHDYPQVKNFFVPENKHKTVFMKSSDLEWEEDVKTAVIHRNNLKRITEMIAELYPMNSVESFLYGK